MDLGGRRDALRVKGRGPIHVTTHRIQLVATDNVVFEILPKNTIIVETLDGLCPASRLVCLRDQVILQCQFATIAPTEAIAYSVSRFTDHPEEIEVLKDLRITRILSNNSREYNKNFCTWYRPRLSSRMATERSILTVRSLQDCAMPNIRRTSSTTRLLPLDSLHERKKSSRHRYHVAASYDPMLTRSVGFQWVLRTPAPHRQSSGRIPDPLPSRHRWSSAENQQETHRSITSSIGRSHTTNTGCAL